MLRAVFAVLACVAIAEPAHAQSRQSAEVVSNIGLAGAWTTLGVTVWRADHRAEAATRASVGLGGALAVTAITKALIHSERPCHARGVSCRPDGDFTNMVSGHAAQSCSVLGLVATPSRKALVISSAALAGLTMWGRHRAWKHTPGALVAGCASGFGIGLAGSRLRLSR